MPRLTPSGWVGLKYTVVEPSALGWTDGFAEWEFAVREATRRSSLWVFGS
jgi:hypothetical protein